MDLGNYQTINDFMFTNGIKSRKTVYNMIEDGRVEFKKILTRTIVKKTT